MLSIKLKKQYNKIKWIGSKIFKDNCLWFKREKLYEYLESFPKCI